MSGSNVLLLTFIAGVSGFTMLSDHGAEGQGGLRAMDCLREVGGTACELCEVPIQERCSDGTVCRYRIDVNEAARRVVAAPTGHWGFSDEGEGYRRCRGMYRRCSPDAPKGCAETGMWFDCARLERHVGSDACPSPTP